MAGLMAFEYPYVLCLRYGSREKGEHWFRGKRRFSLIWFDADLSGQTFLGIIVILAILHDKVEGGIPSR